FKGAQIEFLVSAQCRLQIAAALGEGWWVKHDGVVFPAGGGRIFQKIKGVAFHPLDRWPSWIQRLILFRYFQRRPRAVERRDGVAFSCEVQRESALVAENIKRAAMGVTLSGGIVLALVKKCSGLLAAEAIVVKPNCVDGIDGRGLLAPQQPAWRWRKLFQLANPRIHTLHYAAHFLRRKLLEQFGDRFFLTVNQFHGLG